MTPVSLQRRNVHGRGRERHRRFTWAINMRIKASKEQFKLYPKSDEHVISRYCILVEEALNCLPNSPRQYHRKCRVYRIENMHDVKV